MFVIFRWNPFIKRKLIRNVFSSLINRIHSLEPYKGLSVVPTLSFLVISEGRSGRDNLLLLQLLIHFSFFIMKSWRLFLIFFIVIIVLLLIFLYLIVCVFFTILLRKMGLQFRFIVLSLLNKKGLCTRESFNGFCLLLSSTFISHHLVWMSIISSNDKSFSSILI